MRIDHVTKLIAIVTVTALLAACNPWDDHIELTNQGLNETVMDVLKQQPDLTTFAKILEVTGYDSILVQPQNYTVFAPTNAAWSGLDTTDKNLMCRYVKNLITPKSIPLVSDAFTVSKVQMLNGKFISVSGKSIDGNELSQWNLLAGNGIIHKLAVTLQPRLNIWEFINQDTYSSNHQVTFLNRQQQRTMDLDKSYLLYLDEQGHPVYDTAWIESNQWLSRYALNNEDSTYTVLLLDGEAYSTLKEKYTPYFSIYSTTINTDGVRISTLRKNETDNQVLAEITRDMMLRPVTLTGGETALSVDGVKVRIPASAIDMSYRASNGTVYLINSAEVKMYQNKIKDIQLEGEDYLYSNVASTVISKRFKDWASGNFDVVLSGRDENGLFALSSQSTAFYSNIMNSYLAFAPQLNSVPYKVYWKSYDDLAAHVTANANVPQKMFFSVPGAPSLTWASGGVVTNNFNDSLVFIGQNMAGMNIETELGMWVTTGTNKLVAREQLASHPDFAVDRLPCYSFGTASIWVSTNAFSTNNTTGGSLFLDYIRLVPQVNPDE